MLQETFLYMFPFAHGQEFFYDIYLIMKLLSQKAYAFSIFMHTAKLLSKIAVIYIHFRLPSAFLAIIWKYQVF